MSRVGLIKDFKKFRNNDIGYDSNHSCLASKCDTYILFTSISGHWAWVKYERSGVVWVVQLIDRYAHCGSSGWLRGARGGRERGKRCPWTEFPRPPVPAVPTRVSQSQWTAVRLRLHSEPDSTVLNNIQCNLSRSPSIVTTATAVFPQPLRWGTACPLLLDSTFYLFASSALCAFPHDGLFLRLHFN